MPVMDWFAALQDPVKVAVIAAVASLFGAGMSVLGAMVRSFDTPIKYWFDKWGLRVKLSVEHEYEQRKKLRDLIDRYRGRVLEAAEQLDHRIWNLYGNHGEAWHDMGGAYEATATNYYFRTTIYRFLKLQVLVRQFEREAVFLHAGIANDSDYVFVKGLKALSWACTEPDLFHGLNYDASDEYDHIFSDHLRSCCDAVTREGVILPIEEVTTPEVLAKLDPVLRLFDAIGPTGSPLRWDRLVVFHLLLRGFLNEFGYDVHHAAPIQFTRIRSKLQHRNEIEANLAHWLPKLRLARVRGYRHVPGALPWWRRTPPSLRDDEPRPQPQLPAEGLALLPAPSAAGERSDAEIPEDADPRREAAE